LLYVIDVPHDLLVSDCAVNESVILPVVDDFYRSIVSGCLFNASRTTVPWAVTLILFDAIRYDKIYLRAHIS